MNLIVIYGPPACGKFTIAQELSKITSYKLFHNHLTLDLIKTILPFGTPKFWEEVTELRRKLLRLAAKENVNLIYTFCYYHKEDDEKVAKIKEIIESEKGKVYFVQILCDKEELYKRVENKSRKKYGKIKDLKILNDVLNNHELFKSVPFEPNISINNTKLSPKVVAKKIISSFNLT